MSNITVVTAFFDIGRENIPKEKHGRPLPHYQFRTVDTYFEYFKKLAKLQNDMVIYTTEDLAPRILEARKEYGLEEQTTIRVMDSYMPPGFEVYKEKVQKIMDRSEEHTSELQSH